MTPFFKIALVQLPVPESSFYYSAGNTPLAAGYLASSLIYGLNYPRENIKIIPRDLANNGNDQAIINWLVEGRFHVIGFSHYLWNIERQVFIAAEVKKRLKKTIIIAGGPEVYDGHPYLVPINTDIIAEGEGEGSFLKIISLLIENKNPGNFIKNSRPVDIEELPNPYLTGIIKGEERESILIESMRGCSYHCKYCYYSKNFSDVRHVSDKKVRQMINYANKVETDEIYLMDPSLELTPNMANRLRLIARYNKNKIPIHTEMRLEAVTPTIAKLLKEAGVKSVEVGLQSTNKKSLDAIGRSWNENKFRQGAELLLEQNIEVKTGVIMGLPYDSPSHIYNTLQFVKELRIESWLESYFLAVLPNTRLREETAKYKIRYMKEPPYWVTSTPYLSEYDLFELVPMIEEELDIEYHNPSLPNLLPSKEFNSRITLPSHKNPIELQSQPTGRSLTVIIQGDFTITSSPWMNFLIRLRKENPYQIFNIIYEKNDLPDTEETRKIVHLLDNPNQYYHRVHYYHQEPQNCHSVRLYHLTDNPSVIKEYLQKPLFCDLLIDFKDHLLEKYQWIFEEFPMVWIRGDDHIYTHEIKKRYQGFENLLVHTLDE